MMNAIAAMARTLDRLAAGGDDCLATPLPGLAVMRHHKPGRVRHELYTPVLCFVLQGTKQVALGSNVHLVCSGQALVVSVEVPVVDRVEASHARPYLAVAVDLDLPMLDDIAEQVSAPEARTRRTARL